MAARNLGRSGICCSAPADEGSTSATCSKHASALPLPSRPPLKRLPKTGRPALLAAGSRLLGVTSAGLLISLSLPQSTTRPVQPRAGPRIPSKRQRRVLNVEDTHVFPSLAALFTSFALDICGRISANREISARPGASSAMWFLPTMPAQDTVRATIILHAVHKITSIHGGLAFTTNVRRIPER